jgi:hypothetical protein
MGHIRVSGCANNAAPLSLALLLVVVRWCCPCQLAEAHERIAEQERADAEKGETSERDAKEAEVEAERPASTPGADETAAPEVRSTAARTATHTLKLCSTTHAGTSFSAARRSPVTRPVCVCVT